MMRPALVASVVAVLVAVTPALAQQGEQRDFGAAVRSQQLQERIEMFRQMGMEEDQATLFALLTSGEMDASQALLLMMLMSQSEGGGDDALGLFMLMDAMKRGQAPPQPVVIDRGEILLIVEGGVLYKIKPDTMEVVSQLNYASKGMRTDEMMAILAPALARARAKAQQASCVSNLKQLALAALMYAQDHGEKLPPAAWVGEVEPYHLNGAIMRCPARPELPVAFAMNEKLVGVALQRVVRPAETVLFFEVNVELPDPVGGPDLVPVGGIHDGHINVAYVDGQCQLVSWEEARRQLEQPPF